MQNIDSKNETLKLTKVQSSKDRTIFTDFKDLKIEKLHQRKNKDSRLTANQEDIKQMASRLHKFNADSVKEYGIVELDHA